MQIERYGILQGTSKLLELSIKGAQWITVNLLILIILIQNSTKFPTFDHEISPSTHSEH